MIYSVSRTALNRVLIEAAARQGATLRFMQTCTGIDLAADELCLRDTSSGLDHAVRLSPTHCGGTAPALSCAVTSRRRGLTVVREDRLDHDYKELSVPSCAGEFALEPHALHIWPRGGFMLIALPNLDTSFTATLFLERSGEPSFESLAATAGVQRFLTQQFPDLAPLAPDMTAEFVRHPQGQLSTVHGVRDGTAAQACCCWAMQLIAIVPFHGQGMNAAFEDCAALEDLLGEHDEWETLFAAFEALRRPNTAAIAQMALEKLRRNARYRARSPISPLQGHLTDARGAVSRSFRTALFDGDVSRRNLL